VAVSELDADRTDEAVLVKVQHDARAGLPGGGKRPPAERRLQVVGVHDSRAGAADRPRDLVGSQSAVQDPRGSDSGREPGGITLQGRDLLTELSTQNFSQLARRLLFTPRDAVSMMKE
jgi:hypothetical protein